MLMDGRKEGKKNRSEGRRGGRERKEKERKGREKNFQIEIN